MGVVVGNGAERIRSILSAIALTLLEELGDPVNLGQRLRTEILAAVFIVRTDHPAGEQVAGLIRLHGLVHQALELGLELSLRASIGIDDLNDVIQARNDVLGVLNLALDLLLAVQIHAEGIIADRACVGSIGPDS